MAVITISRQLGSLGEDVAARLAVRLAVRCVDKVALESAFVGSGIPAEKQGRFDERRPGLFDTLTFDKYRFMHYLKRAMVGMAAAGNAVFIGRGSPIFLRGLPGSLHIRLVAPYDVRVERIRDRNDCSEAEARRIVNQSDHDRAGFYRYYFDIEWDSPETYDLTLNTGSIGADEACDFIERSLSVAFLAPNPPAFDAKIRDMQVAIDVTTRILYEEMVPVRFFAASAQGGVVKISGVTNIPGDVERCATLAAQVPGVKSVVQAVSYVPDTVGIGM